MRISSKMVAAMAILGCWSCLVVHRIMAQSQPTTSELVQKLHSDKPQMTPENNCCNSESLILTSDTIWLFSCHR